MGGEIFGGEQAGAGGGRLVLLELTEDETIPRKYKELMMLAMACVIRYPEGIRTHAGYARANGASVEELYAAVAQTMTIGGIPAYRVGINTLQELW